MVIHQKFSCKKNVHKSKLKALKTFYWRRNLPELTLWLKVRSHGGTVTTITIHLTIDCINQYETVQMEVELSLQSQSPLSSSPHIDLVSHRVNVSLKCLVTSCWYQLHHYGSFALGSATLLSSWFIWTLISILASLFTKILMPLANPGE